MTQRVIVTLHLPLDMGPAGRILKAISAGYPDAVVQGGDHLFQVLADPDIEYAERRKIALERRRKQRTQAAEHQP